jgi:threonylcarbamoyladenosine tRNA methylthiotransferase MtaB
MRRNYNRHQYLDVAQRAINAIPGLGLGADVIVGFPGETEEAFENTRDLIEQLPFSYLHVFSYSPRRGTEAHQKFLKICESFLGQQETVLLENQRDKKSGWLKGHTGNFIPILMEGADSLKNSLVPVTIQKVSENQVIGCAQ